MLQTLFDLLSTVNVGVVIGLCLLIACFKNLRSVAPTLMSSIGVLGTFVGILIGLSDFDTQHIDQSIPQLLEGLKFSFGTSIAGLLCSIIYKTVAPFAFRNKEDEKDAAPDNLLPEWYALHQKQFDQIEQLRSSITGQDTDTLIGQLRLLRSDFNDQAKRDQEAQTQFHDKLWLKLQSVTDTLSKSATQEIIDALKMVIQDFNNQLTEQFGQNFKELNQAVFKLVEWQENYKEQLGQMKQSYDHSVSSIQASEQALGQIEAHTQKIPHTMDQLQQSIHTNQQTIQQMNDYLTAFAALKDKATTAFPELKEQISATFAQIQQAHLNATEHYTRLLTQSEQHAEQHQQYASTILTGLSDYADQSAQSLKSHSERSTTLVEQSVDHIKDGAQRIQNIFEQEHADLALQSKQQLHNQAEHHDQALDLMNGYFKEMSRDLQSNAIEIAGTFKETTSQIDQHHNEMQSNFKRQQQQLLQETEQMLESLTRDIKQAFKAMETQQVSASHDIHETVKQSIQAQYQDTSKALQKQMHNLDKNLEQELTEVLQKLGRKLGGISEQFTEDYGKLTREMQQVVAHSKRFN
ncbi:MAG: hypothetical protein ISP86_05100 [Shewanellaceae bacterium]|nr:hypothetical protein [Shewanellaceae bacterium]